jgi:hypothetical protein
MPERFSKTPPSAGPARPERPEKDALAVELGRRGGKKGGKARADAQTPEERSALARRAAVARWERQADDYVESDDGRQTRSGRLNERLRQAFVAGADEHSRQTTGKALTGEELESISRRYPGGIEGES